MHAVHHVYFTHSPALHLGTACAWAATIAPQNGNEVKVWGGLLDPQQSAHPLPEHAALSKTFEWCLELGLGSSELSFFTTSPELVKFYGSSEEARHQLPEGMTLQLASSHRHMSRAIILAYALAKQASESTHAADNAWRKTTSNAI